MRLLTAVLILFAILPMTKADDACLVAYYSFDDGTAKDLSGNGHDGEIHGCSVVEGIIGKALKFDGINDYVEINPSFLLKP